MYFVVVFRFILKRNIVDLSGISFLLFVVSSILYYIILYSKTKPQLFYKIKTIGKIHRGKKKKSIRTIEEKSRNQE